MLAPDDVKVLPVSELVKDDKGKELLNILKVRGAGFPFPLQITGMEGPFVVGLLLKIFLRRSDRTRGKQPFRRHNILFGFGRLGK